MNHYANKIHAKKELHQQRIHALKEKDLHAQSPCLSCKHIKHGRLQKNHDLLLNNSSCGIVIYTAWGAILEINRRAKELLDCQQKELQTKNAKTLLPWLVEGFTEHHIIKKNGESLWININFCHGTLMGRTIYIAMIEDISQRKNQEEAIRLLASFPLENPDPIWRVDSDGTIIYMNPAAQTLSNQSDQICEHEQWLTTYQQVIDSCENREIDITINNQWFRLIFTYVNANYMNIYGSNITHHVATEIALQNAYSKIENKVEIRTHQLTDSNKKLRNEIAARAKTEAKLHDLSYLDDLTQLGNRRYIMERLSHAIDLGKRNDTRHALFFIDLDYFKEINDTLGHITGDELLKRIAHRLKKAVRSSDSVARLGGDEFAILLENVHNESEVTKVAEAVMAAFQEPFPIDKEFHYIHCSLGISLFPDHADNAIDLFRYADIALYQAKEVHNNYRTYSASASAKDHHNHQLYHDLDGALENMQLQMLYQPKVCLADHTICGVEALIRWNHPQKGVISPVEFIPIAEETGMIIPIGKWIIDESCRTLQRWGQQGYSHLHMAINLSPVQFTDKELFKTARASIEKYGLSPHQIEFEITETLAMNDCHQTIQTIRQFVEMGISIALDDFGTGHSSLSRLREMPIHTLKIDRSFVMDLDKPDDDDGSSFVRMIINMAKTLNLSIVAEGVENEAQASFLKGLNCDTGQGYLYSKPITSDAMLKLLGDGISSTLTEVEQGVT